MQIELFLSLCTKLKFKWIKDFNIKPDTLNVIEEKVGKSLQLVVTRGNFQNRNPMAHALRSKIGIWNLMKLGSFCRQKKILSIGQINNLQVGKKSSLSPNPKYIRKSRN